MKNFLTLIFCLGLTGCSGAVILVNVGSTSHSAASVGASLAPEVQCAALATPKITGPVNIDAVQTCLQALQAQKAIDRKGVKP